jgi:hypothetical protein
VKSITVNGKKIKGNLLKETGTGKTLKVVVML